MSHRIDRVAITGASSGIGLDLAKRFLAEGSKVLLNARNADRLERVARSLGAPDRVTTVAGEVGSQQTAKAIAEAARDRLGGIDVLVNNAGIFGVKPFLESTEEELDAFYRTNLKGTYLTTQALVPEMIRGGGGSIVNVGTVLVDQAMVGLPVSAAMASKGGIHALTVSLAAELSPHRIRVNTLAPGIIRTPLIGPNADDHAKIHPLGRIGEVSETSDAVLYLSRSAFVTGSLLPVDGGYSRAR